MMASGVDKTGGKGGGGLRRGREGGSSTQLHLLCFIPLPDAH